MRYVIILLWTLFWSVPPALAQVSIGIGLPGLSIGINLPLFPELVRVPDYPVYYAPRLDSNYFFFDGMYWVYRDDDWYASAWYNGPWGLVDRESVPLFVLRIPVRYYRDPPFYFRGWREDAPPHWGEHWGNEWQQRRSEWNRWSRHAAPAPAPLPEYQRQYSGDRYPHAEQQSAIRSQNYRYQPRDAVVRQHYQEQALPRAPALSGRGQQGTLQGRSQAEQDSQRSNAPVPPQRSGADVARSQPQRGGEDLHRPTPPVPAQASPQQKVPLVQDHKPEQRSVPDRRQTPPQGMVQHEQQSTRPGQESTARDRGASQEPGRSQGPEKDREKGDERGHERGR